jgi:hypothetical protein
MSKDFMVIITGTSIQCNNYCLHREKYYAEGGTTFDEVKDTVNYAPVLRIFILIIYVMGLTQFGKK